MATLRATRSVVPDTSRDIVQGDAFYHPFFWEMVKGKGVLTDLGTLGGNWGVASWINDAGEVIGWADLKGDLTNHPFLWKKGQKMKDLGILKGDTMLASVHFFGRTAP